MFDTFEKLFPSRNTPRQDAAHGFGMTLIGGCLLIYGVILLVLVVSGSEAYPEMVRISRQEMVQQGAVCLFAGLTGLLLAVRGRRRPTAPPSGASPPRP